MKKRYRELLIVVAYIAMVSVLLLAILTPNLLDALEKGRQKRCVGAMRSMGTAWFSWLTDQVGSGAAGAPESRKSPSYEAFVALPDYPTVEEFHSFLDPSGTRPLPPADCPVEIWVGRDPLAESFMRIRMPGPNGVFEECPWEKSPVAQLGSCGDDIVWADGFFVRYPRGAQGN